jgi:hypothetical protein
MIMLIFPEKAQEVEGVLEGVGVDAINHEKTTGNPFFLLTNRNPELCP